VNWCYSVSIAAGLAGCMLQCKCWLVVTV